MGLSPAVPFSPPLPFSASSRSGGTPVPSGGLRACCAAHRGADIACGFGVLVGRSTNVGFVPGSTPLEGSFRRAVARTRRGVPAVVVRRGERLVVVAAACFGGRRFHLRLAGIRVALAPEMSHCRPRYVPVPRVLLSLRVLLDATSGPVIHSTPTRWLESSWRLHPCARCVVFFGRCAQLFACGLVAGVLPDAILIVPCVLTPKSGLWRPACCTPLYTCVALRRC